MSCGSTPEADPDYPDTSAASGHTTRFGLDEPPQASNCLRPLRLLLLPAVQPLACRDPEVLKS